LLLTWPDEPDAFALTLAMTMAMALTLASRQAEEIKIYIAYKTGQHQQLL